MTQVTSRFIKVYAEGEKEGTEIWVDRVTGVNYVFHYRGYMEGFTPLLDTEGKPLLLRLLMERDFWMIKKRVKMSDICEVNCFSSVGYCMSCLFVLK